MNIEIAMIATLGGLVAFGLVWFGWSLAENVRHVIRNRTPKATGNGDADEF